MNGKPVTKNERVKIIELRKTGHSLPEIRKILQRGSSTIFQYVKGVEVLPEYQTILREKQGASKMRALKRWQEAHKKAEHIIKRLNIAEKLLVASCLYWGEGAKRDFSLSNTDPQLIQVFLACLRSLGVSDNRLKVSIRIYEDLNKDEVLEYWAGVIGISKEKILNVNILKGKKIGKLKYGMCRIRVAKGQDYLKLLQSATDVIKQKVHFPL